MNELNGTNIDFLKRLCAELVKKDGEKNLTGISPKKQDIIKNLLPHISFGRTAEQCREEDFKKIADRVLEIIHIVETEVEMEE